MEVEYKFVKFIIHRLDDNKAVLQNEVSTVLIENRDIIEFIYRQEEKSNEVLNSSNVKEFFPGNFEKVIEFLVDNHIIVPYHRSKFNMDKIYIIGDDDDINKMLYDVYMEETTEVETVCILNINDLTIDKYNKLDQSNVLIISFLSKYSKSKVDKLYDFIDKSENSSIFLSYSYNHNIYFNCIYGKFLSTPCHFCTKGIIDGQFYGKDETTTYQNMLDLIYSEDKQFEIGYALTKRQKLTIINTIIKQVDGIIPNNNNFITYKHAQDFTIIYKLDVYSNQITKDTAIFWEMCDCYEHIF